jgi:hypothetical protein
MTTDVEPADEIPSTTVRIKTDYANAWPGSSVTIGIEAEDPERALPPVPM